MESGFGQFGNPEPPMRQATRKWQVYEPGGFHTSPRVPVETTTGSNVMPVTRRSYLACMAAPTLLLAIHQGPIVQATTTTAPVWQPRAVQARLQPEASELIQVASAPPPVVAFASPVCWTPTRTFGWQVYEPGQYHTTPVAVDSPGLVRADAVTRVTTPRDQPSVWEPLETIIPSVPHGYQAPSAWPMRVSGRTQPDVWRPVETIAPPAAPQSTVAPLGPQPSRVRRPTPILIAGQVHDVVDTGLTVSPVAPMPGVRPRLQAAQRPILETLTPAAAPQLTVTAPVWQPARSRSPWQVALTGQVHDALDLVLTPVSQPTVSRIRTQSALWAPLESLTPAPVPQLTPTHGPQRPNPVPARVQPGTWSPVETITPAAAPQLTPVQGPQSLAPVAARVQPGVWSPVETIVAPAAPQLTTVQGPQVPNPVPARRQPSVWVPLGRIASPVFTPSLWLPHGARPQTERPRIHPAVWVPLETLIPAVTVKPRQARGVYQVPSARAVWIEATSARGVEE